MPDYTLSRYEITMPRAHAEDLVNGIAKWLYLPRQSTIGAVIKPGQSMDLDVQMIFQLRLRVELQPGIVVRADSEESLFPVSLDICPYEKAFPRARSRSDAIASLRKMWQCCLGVNLREGLFYDGAWIGFAVKRAGYVPIADATDPLAVQILAPITFDLATQTEKEPLKTWLVEDKQVQTDDLTHDDLDTMARQIDLLAEEVYWRDMRDMVGRSPSPCPCCDPMDGPHDPQLL